MRGGPRREARERRRAGAAALAVGVAAVGATVAGVGAGAADGEDAAAPGPASQRTIARAIARAVAVPRAAVRRQAGAAGAAGAPAWAGGAAAAGGLAEITPTGPAARGAGGAVGDEGTEGEPGPSRRATASTAHDADKRRAATDGYGGSGGRRAVDVGADSGAGARPEDGDGARAGEPDAGRGGAIGAGGGRTAGLGDEDGHTEATAGAGRRHAPRTWRRRGAPVGACVGPRSAAWGREGWRRAREAVARVPEVSFPAIVSRRNEAPWRATVTIRPECLIVVPGSGAPRSEIALTAPIAGTRDAGGVPRRRLAVGPLPAAGALAGGVDRAVRPAVHVYGGGGFLLQTTVAWPLDSLRRLALALPWWVDALPPPRATWRRTGADPGVPESQRAAIATFVRGGEAACRFAILGRPARPVGAIGEPLTPRGPFGARGIGLADQGIWQPTRDSVALDAVTLGTEAARLHVLTHELAHRWLRRHPATADSVFAGVPPTPDSGSVAFGAPEEQRAEALALAVALLRAAAGEDGEGGGARESGGGAGREPGRGGAAAEEATGKAADAPWEPGCALGRREAVADLLAAADRLMPGTGRAAAWLEATSRGRRVGERRAP